MIIEMKFKDFYQKIDNETKDIIINNMGLKNVLAFCANDDYIIRIDTDTMVMEIGYEEDEWMLKAE